MELKRALLRRLLTEERFMDWLTVGGATVVGRCLGVGSTGPKQAQQAASSSPAELSAGGMVGVGG